MVTQFRSRDSRYSIIDMPVGSCTLSVTYLNSGKNTKGHSHPHEEGYYICDGIGRIRLGKDERKVNVGDFIIIPPNALHQVFNDGLMTLTFVCVWSDK